MILKRILRNIKNKFILIFLQRHNKIYSYNVHPKSLTGQNIEIREGTYVDSACSIGSYTYIGRNSAITKTRIGRYCSIANNVSIGQGEHKLDDISTSSIFYKNAYDLLTSKDCIINDDVWIGVDSIILRGVSIGIGSVIGANSVVTNDVPPFAVVVGSPARIVKYRFDDKKIRSILNSKWWAECPDKAKEILDELNKK